MAMDRESELGGLWLRKSSAGNTYMSGKLTMANGEVVEVVVFKNTHKDPGDKKPDYRVYRSQPRDGAPPQQQPQRPQTRRPPAADDLDDDIPF